MQFCTLLGISISVNSLDKETYSDLMETFGVNQDQVYHQINKAFENIDLEEFPPELIEVLKDVLEYQKNNKPKSRIILDSDDLLGLIFDKD